MAQPLILAGDIGGTKTLLGLGTTTDEGVTWQVIERYPSQEYPSFEPILRAFLAAHQPQLAAICLGIAGPIRNNTTRTTNLPWEIDGKALGAHLLNDLEAMAWGIPWLGAKDLVTIQQGTPLPGNMAVMAPGTGLGEAGLFWDGKTHIPWGSEGGNTDFAPRNEQEIEILRFCQKRFGHVATERVVSGPGLLLLKEFFQGDEEKARSQFLACVGAEAGNLVLKSMCVNGLYLAGGTLRTHGALLQTPLFLKEFHDKGRFQWLMEQIPVHLIVQEEVGLLGAARCAHLMKG